MNATGITATVVVREVVTPSASCSGETASDCAILLKERIMPTTMLLTPKMRLPANSTAPNIAIFSDFLIWQFRFASLCRWTVSPRRAIHVLGREIRQPGTLPESRQRNECSVSEGVTLGFGRRGARAAGSLCLVSSVYQFTPRSFLARLQVGNHFSQAVVVLLGV